MGVPAPQSSLPPPRQTEVVDSNLSDVQHLDDLNETVSRCQSRLSDVHGELLYAINERKQLWWGKPTNEWQAALDHENYLLERCINLKQQLTNATERRSRWTAQKFPDTEVPLTTD